MPTDELQRLWQSQPCNPAPVAVEQIRRNAATFHSCIRNRNLREFIAGALAILWFAWFDFHARTWLDHVAFTLLIMGLVYVIWHLYRHGATRRLPAEYGLVDASSFHRGELIRQRDLLNGVVRWYLAPCVPGYLALIYSAARTRGSVAGVPAAAVLVVVYVVVWWINRRAVDRLNRQIEELFTWEERP